jgi:uncharacterized protein YdhG (YjbR/CyaY superfamily)
LKKGFGGKIHSDTAKVSDYISGLTPDKQAAIKEVRKVILENLPEGYQETMNWGMISYKVPLEIYPDTYNGKPLSYVALASQKNHMAVYLMSIYSNEENAKRFEQAYRATGKRYDVGKSCVRFKKLDDLPLPLIAAEVRSIKMDDYIALAKKAGSVRKARDKG